MRRARPLRRAQWLPAPADATFDAPAWSVQHGGVRPEAHGGPNGEEYVLLQSGDATLDSSTFRLTPHTKKLDFYYSFREEGAWESSLRVYVLAILR